MKSSISAPYLLTTYVLALKATMLMIILFYCTDVDMNAEFDSLFLLLTQHSEAGLSVRGNEGFGSNR